MIKLKIFFVVAFLSLIFILGAFVPNEKINRFVLPDGCCNYCLNQVRSDYSRDSVKVSPISTNCGDQLRSAFSQDRNKF